MAAETHFVVADDEKYGDKEVVSPMLNSSMRMKVTLWVHKVWETIEPVLGEIIEEAKLVKKFLKGRSRGRGTAKSQNLWFNEMGRDQVGSPPASVKDDVEVRDYRGKSSGEKAGSAQKESQEDSVSRREGKRRTRDGNESGSGLESGSESECGKEERRRKVRGKRKSRRTSRRRKHCRNNDGSSSGSDSESESESDYSLEYSDSEKSESEEERRRRKKRKEMKRREREERERNRRKREKEKKRKEKEKGVDGDKKRKRKEKEKKSEKGKKGVVSDLWREYGIIREIDMWNKRPEFTAWLLEIKELVYLNERNVELNKLEAYSDKECVENEQVEGEHVPVSEQKADIRDFIGVKDLVTSSLGGRMMT